MGNLVSVTKPFSRFLGWGLGTKLGSNMHNRMSMPIGVCVCGGGGGGGGGGVRSIPPFGLQDFTHHLAMHLSALPLVSDALASLTLRITAVQMRFVAALHPACSC